MAEETPDTPGPQDGESDRDGGRGDGSRRNHGKRPGGPRDERNWRDSRGSERRGEGSRWRPREDRGPRREDDRRGHDRRGGGYRGSERRDGQWRDGQRRDGERRGPRREDDRRGGDDRRSGGYRGHAARGGSARPFREDDNRVYRPRPQRKAEPEIPEHIEAGQLDKAARRELLTLSKENAEGVARHLVAAGECLAADDLDGALAHAENASRRAGRVAIVREVLGFVHYRRAEWAEALREFRTARRLSGSNHLLPHMADVERGMGRPDRAIELSQEPAAQALSAADRVELAIVVSGARRDLGQHQAGVQILRELVRATPAQRSWAPRLYYAYAESLLSVEDAVGAREWFARAVDVDREGVTDAADRLAELDGVDIIDHGEDDPDLEPGESAGTDTVAGADGTTRDGGTDAESDR